VDDLPSSSRQVAINALLKSVESAGPQFDAAQRTAIESIQAFLADALVMLKAEAEQHVSDLAAFVQDFDECNSEDVAHYNNAVADLTAARASHKDCRENDEAAKYEEFILQCEAFVQYIPLVVPGGAHPAEAISGFEDQYCTMPHYNDANDGNPFDPASELAFASGEGNFVDRWIDSVNRGKNYWGTAKTDYPGKFDPCNTARDAWISQQIDCNDKQLAFEQAYCSASAAGNGMCSERTACFSRWNDVYDAVNATKTGRSADRLREVVQLHRLECMFDKLLNETTTDQEVQTLGAQCPAASESTYAAEYGLQLPMLPTQNACESEGVYHADVTGDLFAAEEYNDDNALAKIYVAYDHMLTAPDLNTNHFKWRATSAC
jgi:hypothetical protein